MNIPPLNKMIDNCTQKDVTKPEQMTPEEFRENAALEYERAADFTESKIDLNSPEFLKIIVKTRRNLAKFIRKKDDIKGKFNPKIQISFIRTASQWKQPVSAAAVEAYNITLREGYTKQGDLYVYQPAAVEPITVED